MTSLTFHSELSITFYTVHIGVVIVLHRLRVNYKMMFSAHSVARFIVERHFCCYVCMLRATCAAHNHLCARHATHMAIAMPIAIARSQWLLTGTRVWSRSTDTRYLAMAHWSTIYFKKCNWQMLSLFQRDEPSLDYSEYWILVTTPIMQTVIST